MIRRFLALVPIPVPLLAVCLVFSSLNASEAFAALRECSVLFSSASKLKPKSVAELGFDENAAQIDGRVIYFEHLRAKKGYGTAIVFMGAFTPIVDHLEFKRSFAERSKGEGLIIFDYATMPESLATRARLGISDSDGLGQSTMSDIVRDATAVINTAAVTGPVTAVGYSYGSTPAAAFAAFHRGRVTNLILASPFILQGEHDAGLMQGKQALEAMAAVNIFFGQSILNAARSQAASELAALNIRVYFDSREWPPGIKRDDVLNGLIARIRATDAADLRRAEFGTWPRTTFMFGENENALRRQFQNETVENFNRSAAVQNVGPARVIVVENGTHGLLRTDPVDSANAILETMRR